MIIKIGNIFQQKTVIIAIVSSLLLLTGTIVPLGQANSLSFHVNDFKIKKIGVSHHNPFVIVKGKAGGTKSVAGDVAVEAYLIYTNKGKFGAFSNEGPYKSAKFTTKTSNNGINGNTCIDKQMPSGKVVFSGHKLTLKGIHVNKVSKVLTVDINQNPDQHGNTNCIYKIWSSKGH
jgi:hypothetical protein